MRVEQAWYERFQFLLLVLKILGVNSLHSAIKMHLLRFKELSQSFSDKEKLIPLVKAQFTFDIVDMQETSHGKYIIKLNRTAIRWNLHPFFLSSIFGSCPRPEFADASEKFSALHSN